VKELAEAKRKVEAVNFEKAAITKEKDTLAVKLKDAVKEQKRLKNELDALKAAKLNTCASSSSGLLSSLTNRNSDKLRTCAPSSSRLNNLTGTRPVNSHIMYACDPSHSKMIECPTRSRSVNSDKRNSCEPSSSRLTDGLKRSRSVNSDATVTNDRPARKVSMMTEVTLQTYVRFD
jgi:hypothetical protein